MTSQPIPLVDINRVMDERTVNSRPKEVKASHKIGEGKRWADYLDPDFVPDKYIKEGVKKWTDYLPDIYKHDDDGMDR